jgi:hypothetical protein
MCYKEADLGYRLFKPDPLKIGKPCICAPQDSFKNSSRVKRLDPPKYIRGLKLVPAASISTWTG